MRMSKNTILGYVTLAFMLVAVTACQGITAGGATSGGGAAVGSTGDYGKYGQ